MVDDVGRREERDIRDGVRETGEGGREDDGEGVESFWRRVRSGERLDMARD
jgi:hypothetical protein